MATLAFCAALLTAGLAQSPALPPEDALLRQYLDRDFRKKHFAVSFGDNRHLEPNYPPHILERGFQNDSLLKLGFLNVRHYAKGDGKTDDTAALRQAIYDASFFELTAYFPSGTYLVSEPILCRASIPRSIVKKGFFLTGARDPRPVIRLADRAARFQDPKNPQALLQFWLPPMSNRPGKHPMADSDKWLHTELGWKCDTSTPAGFMELLGLRDIDFDLGTGNPGAAAIRCAGAQGNYIENVTIHANDGFAGLYDLIGAGSYMANIRIVGGRYGIYASRIQAGCIAGLRLENQRELAFALRDYSKTFPLVGFEIVKEKGPVFRVQGTGKAPFLALIDGTVELGQGGPVVEIERPEREEDGNIFMKNVYVRNATAIVQGGPHPPVPLAADSPWTHVALYASCLGLTENVVAGRPVRTDSRQIEPAAAPPADLVSRHLWDEGACPHPLDPDVVNLKDPQRMGECVARGDGTTDDTAAFRYALAHFEKVLIPKGIYVIAGPLTLGSKTKLIGTTPTHSVIQVDDASWQTTKPQTIFSTVDDKEARTMIGHFSVLCRYGPRNLYAPLLWRAGRHSVLKQIRFIPHVGINGEWYRAPAGEWPHPFQMVTVTGNGGGKWYGLWILSFSKAGYFRNKTGPMPEYRHLLVENTHEPLAIYTHNPEHAVPSAEAEVEIRNSRDVQIYGIKSESTKDQKNLYLIKNSRNVTIAGYAGIRVMRKGYAFFRVVDSQDVLLGAVQMSLKQHTMEPGAYTVLQVDPRGEIGVPGDRNVNLLIQ